MLTERILSNAPVKRKVHATAPEYLDYHGELLDARHVWNATGRPPSPAPWIWRFE
jgi:hypothetical protein